MKKLAYLLLILVGLVGCGKDDQSYIPSVAVNFQAPLTDPRLTKLNSAGGAVVINGYGVAGLLIYRTPGGSYVAFDRCSSYQPEKNVRLIWMIRALPLQTHAADQSFYWATDRQLRHLQHDRYVLIAYPSIILTYLYLIDTWKPIK